MHKLGLTVISAALVVGLVLLSGCASADGTDREAASAAASSGLPAAATGASGANPAEEEPFAGLQPATVEDTRAGLSAASALLVEIKRSAEAADAGALREPVERLAGIWLAVEPELLAVDETKSVAGRADLARLLEAAKAERTEGVVDLSYSLYQLCRDLKDRLPGGSPANTNS